MLPEPLQGLPSSPSTGQSPTGILLTSTAATVLLSYVPSTTAGFLLLASFEIVGATTQVMVWLTWTGQDGGAHTVGLTPAIGVSLPPEDYGLQPYPFTALGGQAITLYAKAGTANQVYVTADLWQQD